MAGPISGRWCSLKVRALGKCYEELPLGPKIMVSHPRRAWCPPMDVYECGDSYVIKAAVSGLRKASSGDIENAQVTVEGSTVVIQGRRTDDSPHPKCSYHQMEIYYGEFECRVEIHEPFDRNAIEAEYHDGFLIVIVPKVADARGPRQIEVTG